MQKIGFILTANQQQVVRRTANGDYRLWVKRTIEDRWPGQRVVWETRGHVVRAWVNRGDWVANCPHCPGSQIVEPGQPFYCIDCRMIGNEGYAQKIWFPGARRAIEAILSLRPNPMTRNYLMGETVDGLRAENIEHGLRTDLDDRLLLPAAKPHVSFARKEA